MSLRINVQSYIVTRACSQRVDRVISGIREFVCPHCRRKMNRAISTKFGRHAVHGIRTFSWLLIVLQGLQVDMTT